MIWVANERTGLVHREDCEYAQKICDGRIEFDELYHALSSGYEEAGCCLTDRPYASMVEANIKRKESRERIIGDDGCCICGEIRCVQLAHIIPRTLGGAVTIPMCPTHHKAYDEGFLTDSELAILSDKATKRISPKTGGSIHKMHGMVRQVRERKEQAR